MTEADSIKWALLDLLKVLDVEYGGRLHGEFARIARSLGVELPPVALPVQPENNWKAEVERKMKENAGATSKAVQEFNKRLPRN